MSRSFHLPLLPVSTHLFGSSNLFPVSGPLHLLSLLADNILPQESRRPVHALHLSLCHGGGKQRALSSGKRHFLGLFPLTSCPTQTLGRTGWRLGSGKGGEGHYGFPLLLFGVGWGFLLFFKISNYIYLFDCGYGGTLRSEDNLGEFVLSSTTWVLVHVWKSGEGFNF